MAYRIAVFPLQDEIRAEQVPGLEALADEIPGVRELAVDPIGQLVRMIYDDAQTSILEVAHALAAQGYPSGVPIVTEGRL